MNFTATLKRTSIAMLATAVGAAILMTGTVPAADAAIGPRVVKVTKTKGVRTIGDLKAGPVAATGPLTLADVKAEVGSPTSVRNPEPGVCLAGYGAGLTLIFASFGMERKCDRLYLQSAEIKGSKWRVFAGKKLYRKGMSKKRIPRNAKRFPGYGYQLASMPFLGGRSGSLYAKVGSRGKIFSFYIYIGGAGD